MFYKVRSILSFILDEKSITTLSKESTIRSNITKVIPSGSIHVELPGTAMGPSQDRNAKEKLTPLCADGWTGPEGSGQRREVVRISVGSESGGWPLLCRRPNGSQKDTPEPIRSKSNRSKEDCMPRQKREREVNFYKWLEDQENLDDGTAWRPRRDLASLSTQGRKCVQPPTGSKSSGIAKKWYIEQPVNAWAELN